MSDGDASNATTLKPKAIGLYRRGPAWDSTKPLGTQPAVDAHIAYLGRLMAAGSLLAAGPFHRSDAVVAADLVGLVVFACDAEMGRTLVAQDPAVAAGMTTCEVLPWYP